MESALTARDRVGVQDFVLLENYNSEAAFIENLRRRFRENLIYVIKPVFLTCSKTFQLVWWDIFQCVLMFWLRRTLAQCWCRWTLTKNWRFTPSSRWNATEGLASMRYRLTCESFQLLHCPPLMITCYLHNHVLLNRFPVIKQDLFRHDTFNNLLPPHRLPTAVISFMYSDRLTDSILSFDL